MQTSATDSFVPRQKTCVSSSCYIKMRHQPSQRVCGYYVAVTPVAAFSTPVRSPLSNRQRSFLSPLKRSSLRVEIIRSKCLLFLPSQTLPPSAHRATGELQSLAGEVLMLRAEHMNSDEEGLFGFSCRQASGEQPSISPLPPSFSPSLSLSALCANSPSVSRPGVCAANVCRRGLNTSPREK